MKRIVLAASLIVISTAYNNLLAQKLDKNYIDNWVLETFLDSDIDTTTIYVINGKPFDGNIINDHVSRYNISDLTFIYYLDKNQPIKGIYGTPQSHIILVKIGKEKRKLIVETLKDIKEKHETAKGVISENNCINENPALIVNGTIIHPTKYWTVLYELKVKHIKGINIIKVQVNQNTYGRNGKNGLIIVALK